VLKHPRGVFAQCFRGKRDRRLTGVTFLTGELLPKRLELLRELLPTAGVIAVLLNPNHPNFETRLRDVQEGARSVGQQILVLYAKTRAKASADPVELRMLLPELAPLPKKVSGWGDHNLNQAKWLPATEVRPWDRTGRA
jgi:hypothetical protein